MYDEWMVIGTSFSMINLPNEKPPLDSNFLQSPSFCKIQMLDLNFLVWFTFSIKTSILEQLFTDTEIRIFWIRNSPGITN